MPANTNKLVTEDTFVRHLPYSAVTILSGMLDINSMWEQLAAVIPAKPDFLFTAPENEAPPRYTMDHIMRFAMNGQMKGKSSLRSLLVDWGSQNCRLKHLIKALRQANLTAAANYVANEVITSGSSQSQPAQASGTTGASNLPASDQTDSSSNSNSYNNSRLNNPSSSNSISSSSISNSSNNSNQPVGNRERVGSVSSNGSEISCNVHVVDLSKCGGPPATGFTDTNISMAATVVSHRSYGERKTEEPQSGQPAESEQVGSELQSIEKQLISQEQSVSRETDNKQLANKQASVDESDKKSKDDIDFASLGLRKEIKYDTLRAITNSFDTRNFSDGGNLIGEGGFGTVFIGKFHCGYQVAIKCLKEDNEDSLDQFTTEVKTLSQFKHDNLVLLLGYSTDGKERCLIYQYMPNGSLEDRLACRYGTPPLSNDMRVHIIRGTAQGLDYLHKGGLTHRDIKSANILLDVEFNPKVGDFATAKVAPAGWTKSLKATTVIGTAAYLAPEAFSFVIHTSLDAFSYGVVLLEVLTGLPVIDKSREVADLKLFVLEHCTPEDEDDDDDSEDDEDKEQTKPGTIFDLLDPKGGEWDKQVVEVLYSLSDRCLQQARRRRPNMETIIKELDSLRKKDEASADSSAESTA